MTKKKTSEKKDNKTLYEFFAPMKDLQGVDLYRFWRQINFELAFEAIETKQKTKIERVSLASGFTYKDIMFFIDAGFFHRAYEDNLKISLDLFESHFQEKEKFYVLINIIDKYIKPPSKKTADFSNMMNKGLAGLLAYKLSGSPQCSEHLALHIAKQFCDIKSEQTVFDSLHKIKKQVLKHRGLPKLANLALFYGLFLKPDRWKKISPRAKHTKSRSDLNIALNYLQDLREKIIGCELKEAQKCLRVKECPLREYMNDDFLNKIFNYDPKTTDTDDELVLAVLWASSFNNPNMQEILTKS